MRPHDCLYPVVDTLARGVHRLLWSDLPKSVIRTDQNKTGWIGTNFAFFPHQTRTEPI